MTVVTKCQKEWICEQNNADLSKLILKSKRNYLEFNLDLDREDDSPWLSKHNREQRKKSIKELIHFVEENSFGK